MTATPIKLSLVLPAFNEEARIGASLKRLGEFLHDYGAETELIVVDDGSGPAGRKAIDDGLEALRPDVRRSLIRFEGNRGKGAAVRAGSLAARGEYVAFIDADLASPPEDLPVLLAALDSGADVAIGIRAQADGSDMRSQRHFARKMAGQLFSLTMRTFVLPGITDSQCPLKAFKRSAAQRLFRLQRIETWAFDAEVLFLAGRLGLRVVEIPVRWHAVEGSHLKLDGKSAMELWNLVRIRWSHRGVSASTLSGEIAEPA